MLRRTRTAVVWLLLLSTLLIGVPLLPQSASAQKRLPVELHERVVKIVSQYMAGGLSLPDDLLERCGFHPAVGAAAWSHFPPAQKIEAAYHSAEAAAPGGGGEVWLALLAQELARRYESAANDPLLHRLVSAGKVKDCPAFSATLPPRRGKLSGTHRVIIDRLASYCGGGATGYIADTAARYLQVPIPVARQMFTHHGVDIETGLRRLSEGLPEGRRFTAMLGLYEHLASNYPALRDDPELKELMRRAEAEQRRGASAAAANKGSANPSPAPLIKRDPPPATSKTEAVKNTPAGTPSTTFITVTQPAELQVRPRIVGTLELEPSAVQKWATPEPVITPATTSFNYTPPGYGIFSSGSNDSNAYGIGLSATGLGGYNFGVSNFNFGRAQSYGLYNGGFQSSPTFGSQNLFVTRGLGVSSDPVVGRAEFLRSIQQPQQATPVLLQPYVLRPAAPLLWNDPLLRPGLERFLIDRITQERGPLAAPAAPQRQPAGQRSVIVRPQSSPPRAGDLQECPTDPPKP